MSDLLTKRVRVLAAPFNHRLKGMTGTVVAEGADGVISALGGGTAGLIGVNLDQLKSSKPCWFRPEELEVTSC